MQHTTGEGAKKGSPRSIRRDAPVTSNQVLVLAGVLMRLCVPDRGTLKARGHFVVRAEADDAAGLAVALEQQLRLLAGHLDVADGDLGLLTEDQCQVCKREGFFHDMREPLQPVYRMGDAERRKLPDLLTSWEYFGHSRTSKQQSEYLGFAQPELILSNRVVRFFLERKVPRVSFIPVRFL